MKIFSTTSASGRKARAPRWWLNFGEKLPKFSLPFIRPKVWSENLAERWINMIPDKCPFERQIWIGETLIFYIPALCSLNPLSKQLYSIKLEAQTFLYDLKHKNKV